MCLFYYKIRCKLYITTCFSFFKIYDGHLSMTIPSFTSIFFFNQVEIHLMLTIYSIYSISCAHFLYFFLFLFLSLHNFRISCITALYLKIIECVCFLRISIFSYITVRLPTSINIILQH